MKNILIQVVKTLGIIVAVLAINVVTACLAFAAFFIPMFKGDWLLGVVCGLFAVPGILLQPWSLLFLVFFPTGILYAPILTTLVTVVYYRTQGTPASIQRVRADIARRGTSKVVIVSVCVVFLMLSVGYARSIDFPPLRWGVPELLERRVEDPELDTQVGRYYCLGRFLDKEWIWQARVGEATLDRIVVDCQMRTVAREDVSSEFMQMRPYWWKPTVSETTQAYTTENFVADSPGRDGWNAFMTWEPESQVLHMWIKDNW